MHMGTLSNDPQSSTQTAFYRWDDFGGKILISQNQWWLCDTNREPPVWLKDAGGYSRIVIISLSILVSPLCRSRLQSLRTETPYSTQCLLAAGSAVTATTATTTSTTPPPNFLLLVACPFLYCYNLLSLRSLAGPAPALCRVGLARPSLRWFLMLTFQQLVQGAP